MAPSYELLLSPEPLRELVYDGLIAAGKPVGLDIETGYDGESREGGSLKADIAFPVSIQYTNSLDWARMTPLRFDSGVNTDNFLAAEYFWDLVHAVDAEGLPLIVPHGAKFERRMLARWFFRHLVKHPRLGEAVWKAHGYFPVRSCTLLESYAEGDNPEHGLKEITWRNYRYRMRELLSLFNKGGKPLTEKESNSIRFNVLNQWDPEVVSYACEDAVYCLKHHLDRWPRVRNNAIYKIEMAVLHECTCAMEDTGIAYDWAMMREGSRKAQDFSELYKAEVLAGLSVLAGEPVVINLASPPQLRDVLYNKCGMPVSRWTDGGKSGKKQPSTDAKTALKGLSRQYPEVQKLLNWKGLMKLSGTYLDVYETNFAYAPDGRAHPSYIQHGAGTGRTSAADPPYQQSPKKYLYKLADGRSFAFNFRDVIKAPEQLRMWWEIAAEELGLWTPPETEPGWYILGYDYSQIELRVYAGEAGEKALLDAFERGDDVHRLTAALMLGVPLEHVTKEQRDVGKTMNFALAYGMTEDGLADRLGITREEAADLFTQYHAAYPKLKQWSDRTIAESRRTGWVRTKFGRKVRIWQYDSPIRRVQREGERSAGNAPIQGSSTGDYKKLAMIRAVLALREAGLEDRVRLFMDVHDALEFYVRLDVDPQTVIDILQPAVVFPVEGWPPMEAVWHVGERWGSVLELEQHADGRWRLVKTEEEVPEVELTGDEEELAVPGPTWQPQPPVRQPVAGSDAYGNVYSPQVLTPPGVKVPPPLGGPHRRVRIALLERPSNEQAQALAAYLTTLPGPNTVTLCLPEGRELSIGGTSGLSPRHEPEVSLIFGRALVYYDEADLDASSLTDGLDL